VADAAEPGRGPQRLAPIADGGRLFFPDLAQGVNRGDAPGQVLRLPLAAAAAQAGVVGSQRRSSGWKGRRVEIDLLQR
jgi:hypothetical protein